jgi:hypothetical protein
VTPHQYKETDDMVVQTSDEIVGELNAVIIKLLKLEEYSNYSVWGIDLDISDYEVNINFTRK